MEKKNSKLHISRETIRSLTETEMDVARGGLYDYVGWTSAEYCGPSTNCSGTAGCPGCEMTNPCPRSKTICQTTTSNCTA